MIRWPQICALRDATTTLALPICAACNLFQRVCFSQLVFDTQPGKLHLAIIGAPPHNLVKLLSRITYHICARRVCAMATRVLANTTQNEMHAEAPHFVNLKF
jgi:hypothetical protein